MKLFGFGPTFGVWFKSLFAISSNKTWLSVGDDGLIVSNVWFMHSDARLQHQLAQSHGKLAQPQLHFYLSIRLSICYLTILSALHSRAGAGVRNC